MGKQLKKKLIVTANLDNLKEGEFRRKAKGIIHGHLSNPTYVPGLTPAASDLDTESQTLDNLIEHRSLLVAQLLANTEKIRGQVRKIKNVIVSEWAPQVQKAVGTDQGKVKGLGYGIKGIDNGRSLPEYNMSNSQPMIFKVDLRVHLKHILSVSNNKLKGKKLPHDAKRLELYMSFGETEPVDYHKMTYLGEVIRGKFENNFKEEDIGKWVWYVAVYIGRKKATWPVPSWPEKAMVV
jgi:hypothetical protein